MGFAHGPHVCLGMHLARIEMRAALDAVAERLATIHPHGAQSPIQGLVFRKPQHVPVAV